MNKVAIIVMAFIVFIVMCFACFAGGWNKCDEWYKTNLRLVGYTLETHYIEKDGVRTNWVELVKIEKSRNKENKEK